MNYQSQLTSDREIHHHAYQFFLEEVPELLQTLETGLLNLHQRGGRAQIHDLMRSAHSIKGGAATVGLDALASIAHRLESILRGICSQDIAIDTELETWLLEAYDCLQEPLLAQIESHSFDSEAALNKAERVFPKIERCLGDALLEADNYLPSSGDLGVDMVSSIFEVDVAQGIERLATVLANSESYEVIGELRAQADVFAGFSEILNLPGFGEIARLAIEAVDARPELVLEIIKLALVDWQAARESVLAGDRDRGGNPSGELLKLAGTDSPEIWSSEAPTILHTDDLDSSLDDIENTIAADNQDAKPEAFLESAIVDLGGSNVPQAPLPVVAEQKTQLQSTARIKSASNLKVKVDLKRLERMNNFVGELVIERNSLASGQEQLRSLVGKIKQRLEKFQALTQMLPQFSLQTVPLESNTSISPLASKNLTFPTEELQPQLFDVLEMDNDCDRLSSFQEVQEEIIQLEEALEDLTLFSRQSNHTVRQQEQILTKLREELMWARMFPLEKILNHFPRALRDLANRYEKPVSLEMKGTDILVDKGILEKIHDPLLHLLRNAFDHGIETSEVRLKQGKSPQGKISITASHQGNSTVIEIGDDGRGLDLMKIAQRGIDRGWISIEQLTQCDRQELLDFIFAPGFSTADRVSELSGRGVGLDVVRSQLQEIKGTVAVDSTPGQGTTFTLHLPLTLTIAKLLVCNLDNKSVALPVASIQEIVLAATAQTKNIGDRRVLSWREQLIPVYRLRDLLTYGYPIPSEPNLSVANGSALLVIRSPNASFALEIEDFATEQEMTIKPLNGTISPPNYVYGCTVTGRGNLIPTIDPVTLLAYHQAQKESAPAFSVYPPPTEAAIAVSIPKVLVVDDSAMMRRTLAVTLQKVGYRIVQAKDGAEALELLRQDPAINLIVSDLEMPKVNGFEFLGQLKIDPLLSNIPVVLLTTRSNDKHRRLALHLGAKAYLSKPYIEQEFLEVLENTIQL